MADRNRIFPIKASDRKRLAIIGIFICCCFSALLAQFYKVQIIEGEEWSKKAERQHFFVVNEPFMRGRFFSNTKVKLGHPEKPQPFVVDIQKFHLYIDPISIPEQYRNDISNQLMGVLDLSINERLAFREQFNKKSRSRRLSMWLDPQRCDLINEWWRPYCKKRKIPRNAIFFTGDYQRSYPFGKLLGQVLHTIQPQKNEVTKQALPTGGLEYSFHKLLSGKQGKRRMMRSPRHSFETGVVIDPPENGADIYLSINHCLQAICEEEVEKGVKLCKAKSGWAAMMNPYTGEILALAQYPFFFPPDYQTYFNDPILIDHTRVKAVTDANEPGSIMKVITLAIALSANEELKKRGESPLFDPEEMIATADGRFPGRSKPIRDTHQHKFLNMNMALQKSSNIYMGRIVDRIVKRLGNEWYRTMLQERFGFSQKTGVELPSESAGVLPKPGKLHPNGKLEWSVPTPYSLAMGHNLQANTIQMLRAFSVVANGGYLVQPTLVRKIIKAQHNGKQEILIDHTLPEWKEKFPQVLSKEVTNRVIEAAKYVTKPGGSGHYADVYGYTELGKTGTPNKIVNGTYSKSSYCPCFIGFTPVNNPAFVLMVVMDEPSTAYRDGVGSMYYGSVAAAPVFKQISRRSLEYLGIPQDDPHGFPSNDPRYDSQKADWMIETQQLKEMYEKWNK